MFQFCRQTEQIAEQMMASPPKKLWGVLPAALAGGDRRDYPKCDLRIIFCGATLQLRNAGSSVGKVASLVNCDWNGKMSLTA
jgi:hypothetical protein